MKEHTTHEKHEPKNKSDPSKILIGISVIQVLLLVFVAFQISNLTTLNPTAAVVAGNNAPIAAPPRPSAPAPTVDMAQIVDDDPVKGDPNAPVTIVEFSDYECPFCTRFYQQTLSQIDEQYIKTGKVKFIYRDFPLSFHPNAQKAAEAAECADDQGKYYEMHDMLFEKGVTGGVSSFKTFATNLALDTATFNECLDSGKYAQEVQKDMKDGSQAGVQGTPAFFINGKLISGAQPFSVFQAEIEAILNS